MINYSTCMRGNPTDKDAAKKAYANAQYSQVMTLDKFCYHIASHGCVYSRADIQAILILAVDLPARAVVERTADTDGRSGRIFEQYPKPRRPFDGRVHCGEHHRGERTVGSGRPFQQPAPRCRIPTGSHAQGSRRSSEGIEGRKDYGRPDGQFFCRRHCR